MKMVIAADHGGFELKEIIKSAFKDVEWIDLGTNSKDSVNYADFGHKAAKAVLAGQAERGIVLCGSGIGISIAANRHKGIRAALCTDSTMARLSRLHNNANLLALGGRITGVEVALDCVRAFISTEYEGGRHQARIEAIEI